MILRRAPRILSAPLLDLPGHLFAARRGIVRSHPSLRRGRARDEGDRSHRVRGNDDRNLRRRDPGKAPRDRPGSGPDPRPLQRRAPRPHRHPRRDERQPGIRDGKLLGAVAYSWGFTKDAIAGITPIEEMLAVAMRNESPRRTRSADLPRQPLTYLRRPDRLIAFFDARRLLALAPRVPAATSLAYRWRWRVWGESGSLRVAADLGRAGFVPMQGGGAGSAAKAAPPRLEPGSPVGVKLVRGDVTRRPPGPSPGSTTTPAPRLRSSPLQPGGGRSARSAHAWRPSSPACCNR